MLKLQIIKPGLMTSIQDMGRKGLAYYAIPPSGVMDKNAAKIALLLLNQKEDAPLIECTGIAPHIKFHNATQIAISGADFSWTINETPISRNTVINVKTGDTLRGKMAADGFRAYIAIKGKLKIEKVYNSHATYTNAKIGGYEGRLLKKGDVIEWEEEVGSFGQHIIPIKQGPEFNFLTEKAKQQLVSTNFIIGHDSNRMGLRLSGDRLESTAYQLEHSSPVLPGFIQLPPSGLPIVILQDGQVSGGYPRIAYIHEDNLSSLNQIPLGGALRFRM